MLSRTSKPGWICCSPRSFLSSGVRLAQVSFLNFRVLVLTLLSFNLSFLSVNYNLIWLILTGGELGCLKLNTLFFGDSYGCNLYVLKHNLHFSKHHCDLCVI